MQRVPDQLKVALADRYVIERELGQGGMATVYLAHDVRHNRKVALKVLRPEDWGQDSRVAEVLEKWNVLQGRPVFAAGELRSALVSGGARAMYARLARTGGGRVNNVDLAFWHLHLGENERALDLLEASAESNYAVLTWLSLGWFAALDGGPRYQALMSRLFGR